MPSTAKVRFNISDLTFSIASLLKGISFVGGVTLRGPINDPNEIITSWPQFEKQFGGLIPGSDFPHLCKRALERGSLLRVGRQGHYTDPTDASTLDAIKSAIIPPRILTFSAALISLNTYNLTINGTAIAASVFATDSNTTMALIATNIAASPYVNGAYVVPVVGSNLNRVILIFPKVALTLTVNAVTLGASQATVVPTASTAATVLSKGNQALFTIAPKNHGADYDNLSMTISNASNGNANYFNLAITHATDSFVNESYENLIISGIPNQANSHYLDTVIKGTQLLAFTYGDLSGLTAPLRPVNATYKFTGGSNGTAPGDSDYIGDAGGKNGLHAFDGYDDAMQMGFPEISANAVHIAGAAYAASRADLQYYAHLSNANTTSAGYITDRTTTVIDTPYCAFFGGGLKVTDPITGLPVNISELGDIFGICAYSDSVAHEWFSFAGRNRGFITNALGIVNNFGTAALSGDLELLAQRQINMVVSTGGKMFLSGNFSAQLATSQMSFNNTVRFIIFQKKSLGPSLQAFLEEPADLNTLKAIFRGVKPFFENLIAERALFSYVWDGDQGISKIENVQVNNLTQLGLGKYKVRLYEKIIPSLQEIAIDITITPLNVSFEVLQNQA